MGREVEIVSKEDRFQGLECELSLVNTNADSPENFESQLASKLREWKQNGYRGIWFKVPKDMVKAGYLETVMNEGFELHHCMKEYVMLTKWLPDPNIDPDMMPNFATHFIGVGGLVVNQRNEILVVSEKYSIERTTRHFWKLPGGLVDPHERFSVAVEREVHEETGIKASFQHISCFRHNPNFRMDRNDIYFICLLKLDGEEIQEPQSDPKEIAAAKWIKIEDFLSYPDVYVPNRQFIALALGQSHFGRYPIAGFPEYNLPMKYSRSCLQDVYVAGSEADHLPRMEVDDIPLGKRQPDTLQHPVITKYMRSLGMEYDPVNFIYYKQTERRKGSINGEEKSAAKRAAAFLVTTLGIALIFSYHK